MRKQSKRKPRNTGLPLVFGLTATMRTDLDLIPFGTLESFREGTATEEAAHTLAAAVNLVCVLAREYAEEVQRIAHAGLKAIGEIFLLEKATGLWGCTEEEYRAIGEALNLSSRLQRDTTLRNVAQAIRQVLKEAGV